MEPKAALVSHTNTEIVTRAQLAAIEPPAPSATWKPVAHIELVETLGRALGNNGMEIEREEFALRRDGLALFGVLQINTEFSQQQAPDFEGRWALGFRASNDKSLAIQIVAGMTVFVCDNLVLRGDFIALRRKHTSGLNLFGELEAGVLRYTDHIGRLKDEIIQLRGQTLTDDEAKATICDVFRARLMPVRFLPAVADAYLEPRHAEFKPRTAWSLHNAFTEVAKQMPLTTRIEATQEIGKFFGMVGADGRRQ